MFPIGLVASMALVVIAVMEQTVQGFYADNMAAIKSYIENRRKSY